MSLSSRLVSSSLRKLGIHEAVRFSKTYYRFLRFTHPDYYRHLRADEGFYRRLFERPINLAFDIGANIGDKVFVLSRVAKTIVAVEPDPLSFRRLQRHFGNDPNVALEGCAVGDRVGWATFYQGLPGSAYNTLNPEWHEPSCVSEDRVELRVAITTLDDLIEKHGLPDYVKIDVEGYEWPVIQGLSRRVPVLSFEANLPQFHSETLNILQHLDSQSPGATFQVRAGEGFIFPARHGFSQALEWLKSAEQGSYEVFVFSGMFA